MWTKKFDKVQLITRNVPIRRLKQEWKKSSLVVVFNSTFLQKKRFKNEHKFTDDTTGIDIFADDDGKCYLTNVDLPGINLNIELLGLRVEDDDALFYIGENVIKGPKKCVDPLVLTTTFFEVLFGTEAVAPPMPLKRIHDELENDQSSIPSSPKRLRPEEDENVLDDISTPLASSDEIEDVSESISPCETSSPKKISSTKLDEKIAGNVEIERYRAMFHRLVYGDIVATKEVEISSKYLARDGGEDNESSLNHFKDRIANGSSLAIEQITCYKKDSSYIVVDGKKRAAALATSPHRLISIATIDEKDQKLFLVGQQIKKLIFVSVDALQAINLLRDSFVFMELNPDTVAAWPSQTKQRVFEPFCKKYSIDFVKVASTTPLFDAVNKLSHMRSLITANLIAIVVRKYRVNSVKTVDVLSKVEVGYEKSLFKELAKVEVDVYHLLRAKKVPEDILVRFVTDHGEEEHFKAFIKSEHLRSNQKIAKYSTLISKYNEFVAKIKKLLEPPSPATRDRVVDVSEMICNFDVFLVDSTNHKVFENVGHIKNGIILLFGHQQVDSSSNHTLILPVNLVTEDETECLNNSVKFSLYLVTDGEVMPVSDAREAFSACSIPYAQFIMMEWIIKLISSFSTVYCDLPTFSQVFVDSILLKCDKVAMQEPS